MIGKIGITRNIEMRVTIGVVVMTAVRAIQVILDILVITVVIGIRLIFVAITYE